MPLAAALLLSATLCVELHDPIAVAQARFEQLKVYQATVTSISEGGTTESIRYSYRKPGFVRMDFLKPYNGMLVIYDPIVTRARVWPLGTAGPSIALHPDNRLIRSARGHRVDRSDVGVLLENIRKLQNGGSTRILGSAHGDDHCMVHLRVVGRDGNLVDGIHRYEIWFDQNLGFPVRVIGYDEGEQTVEIVTLSEIVLEPPLEDDFFHLP